MVHVQTSYKRNELSQTTVVGFKSATSKIVFLRRAIGTRRRLSRTYRPRSKTTGNNYRERCSTKSVDSTISPRTHWPEGIFDFKKTGKFDFNRQTPWEGTDFLNIYLSPWAYTTQTFLHFGISLLFFSTMKIFRFYVNGIPFYYNLSIPLNVAIRALKTQIQSRSRHRVLYTYVKAIFYYFFFKIYFRENVKWWNDKRYTHVIPSIDVILCLFSPCNITRW